MKKTQTQFISVICIIALLSGLAALSGCAKGPDGIDGEKITVALDWTPNTNHTGLYVALDRGYYKALGLDVEIIEPASDTALDLTAAGNADIAVSFQEEVTAARTADSPLPVKAVAAVLQHNTSGFASLSEMNILTPRDFEGRRYGSWGTQLERGFLEYLMAKAGADYNKVIYINDNSTDFLAGVRRSYDFSWIYYGWDGIAAEIAGVSINFMPLRELDGKLDFYTPVLIAGESLIDDRPETLRKFLEATARGYADCATDPEGCADILLKYAPEIGRELAVKSLSYLAEYFIADARVWGVMKESVWVDFSAFMLENGIIDRPLDVSAAFTNEFLPR